MVRQTDIIRQQQELTAVANDRGTHLDEVFGSCARRPELACVDQRKQETHEGINGIPTVRPEGSPKVSQNMFGNQAPTWSCQSQFSPAAVAGQEGGVVFDGARGHCFVCNIELTSPQHKAQHVEGKNHKKKAGQAGSGGGTGGVMMCAICEVTLSGQLNVQQHFSSERHRKRVAEQQQQQLQSGVGIPGAAATAGTQHVPTAGTQHVPTAPERRWVPMNVSVAPSATSPQAVAFTELSSGPASSMYRPARPAYEPVQDASPPNLQTHVLGGQVVQAGEESELLRFEWLSNGCGFCGFCDLRVQSHDEAAEHLKSEEHKCKENEANKASCEECRVKFSGQASAKQHFSSEKHKNQVLSKSQAARSSALGADATPVSVAAGNEYRNQSLTSSQLSHLMSGVNVLEETVRKAVADSGLPSAVSNASHVQYGLLQAPHTPASSHTDRGLNQLNEDSSTPVAMTHFNIPPSNYGGDATAAEEAATKEASGEPIIPEYVFDGSRGICNVCSVTFTSRPHAEAHLAGSKHQKAKQRWLAAQVTPQPAAFVGSAHIAANLPQPAFDSPAQFGVSTQSQGSNKGYRFENDRGYCFACRIDLTSVSHANQHLTGRRHQAAVERWLQEGEGCVYPLYCTTCHKPFTGQESAAQHFASDKHKKKILLASEVAASRRDPETGALVVTQDAQVWYICEVCSCPLNTLEQMRIHLRSPRHNKEMEKAQKQQGPDFPRAECNDLTQFPDTQQSANPFNFGAAASDDPKPLDKEAADAAPNYEHLVIQPPMVTRTPGIFFPAAQEAPPCTQLEPSHTPLLRSGSLQVTPGARAILGATGAAGAAGEGTQIMTPDLMHPAGSGLLIQAGGSVIGGRGQGSAYSPVNVSAAGRGRGFLASLAANSPSSDAKQGRSSSPFYTSQDLSDLNLARSVSRVSRSSSGGGRSGQVIRPDGDYEDDEEEDGAVEKLPRTSSSSYVDRPLGELADQPEDDQMSSVSPSSHNLSSTVSEHAKRPPVPFANNSLLNSTVAAPESSLGSLENANQLQPERGMKGFRYCCRLCQQPMNTREDYEKHLKGTKHQIKAATVCAPDNSSEPLIKSYPVTVEEAYEYVGKSTPRVYQVELMCKAMASDSTVVYLPTGTGKTLAAMMTLSFMLVKNPTRPVLFLVDKVLLVLQQARYIIRELDQQDYLRPNLEGEVTKQNQLKKRKLKVAVLCGGLNVRDGTPLWKHDVIVTTAAFCQNLLQMGVLRWANFGLVVFDEAHHCTKNHPYNKLLSEHHLTLTPAHRPKVLGLTASPAGRRTKEETLSMLETLLQNLGGATIATVEQMSAREQLEKFSSSAVLVPVCVPMTEAEVRFHTQLLAYFIRTYLELMRCSNLPQMSDRSLQELYASSQPDPKRIQSLAQHLLETPDQLSDMVHLAHTARLKQTQASRSSKFGMLQFHVMTVGMALLNSEDGIDFVLDELEREFDPKLNPNFTALCDLGLPCQDIAAFVHSIVDTSRMRASEGSAESTSPTSMSIFQELLCTLADPNYMSWGSDDAMALVLVRERKVAHKVREQLRKTSFVHEHHMDVAVVVGHGAGSGEGEGMNLRKQDKVLQGIKSHKYKIVVATSVAEEGVDLPECQLVVCLNPPTTVKAMVQMRGRARKKDSYFVVLCSSQKEKEKLEDLKRQEDNMKWAADHLTHRNTSTTLADTH